MPRLPEKEYPSELDNSIDFKMSVNELRALLHFLQFEYVPRGTTTGDKIYNLMERVRGELQRRGYDE